MLLQTSPEFRKFFLLEFTKELIKASKKFTIISEKKQILNIPRKQLPLPSRFNNQRMQFIPNQTPQLSIQRKIIPPQNRQLVQKQQIPNPSLPLRLQYLKPIPTNIELNLGKLKELLRDPTIQLTECDGPGKEIIVYLPSPKTTGIVLNQEEIDAIIKEFSDKAKIPIEQGIFKVAAGNLILLAAISELVGIKFIIKKIVSTPQYPPQINTFSV